MRVRVHSAKRQLTFAGPQAFDPRVVNIFLAATPTHPKPSAIGSAATGLAGLLEDGALGAPARLRSRRLQQC